MTKPVDNKDDGARVFADATQTSRNLIVEEGWVLPGGRRTKDFEVAQAYARWIDAHCRVWGR